MTLTELEYVIALADIKHFGKAATHCHVSQPTLSIAIKKIESTLRTIIFERDRHTIHITDTGKKIIAQAKRVLAESQTLKEIVAAEKSQLTMPLKIGAIYTVAPYLYPRLIPAIKKQVPHLPIIIQEDFTENLKVKLQNGTLDVIFIALPFLGTGIVKKTLYDEPFVVLMRKDHPLAKRKSIDTSDLRSETLLLLEQKNCLRDQVLKICPHCYENTSQQKTMESATLETLRYMVMSGLGITILPGSATAVRYHHHTLITKPFAKKNPQRTIALAWRASFPRTKIIDVLIRSVADCDLDGVCVLAQ